MKTVIITCATSGIGFETAYISLFNFYEGATIKGLDKKRGSKMKLKMFNYVDDLQEAIVFYQRVFDAGIGENFKRSDGTYELCEIKLSRGTSFWLAERKGESAIEGNVNTGNIMQLCLMYDKADVSKLEKAYAMLKADALEIRWELMKAAWTSHTCDLIDKYGLRWCLMVD